MLRIGIFGKILAMDIALEASWKAVLKKELDKPYFNDLIKFVKFEYTTPGMRCFPPADQIFSAFDHCPFHHVNVVIIGQDPYHGFGQAHGLCFSVNDGIAFPPSLRNIFEEVKNDTGTPVPNSGNLMRWADQGILLLNATLTVREGMAGSHQNKGWEKFTDAVIQAVSDQRENVVFLLWGSYAQKKGKFIDRSRHLVLETGHPSPLSANRGLWFGNGHFTKTNDYLIANGKTPVRW